MDLHEVLRSLRVWEPGVTELGTLEPEGVPDGPVELFGAWLGEAVAAGQVEPHTMSLATTDGDGLPDARIVMLHGVDEHGWSFASHSGSAKGLQLADRPHAALVFYWPVHGRQVRVRGPVATAPAAEAQADLHARSTGALASALTGRQSRPLGSLRELAEASEAAWRRAELEPTAAAPSWTLYRLRPDTVEFFQGEARRRHIRLVYRREGDGWGKELLWP